VSPGAGAWDAEAADGLLMWSASRPYGKACDGGDACRVGDACPVKPRGLHSASSLIAMLFLCRSGLVLTPANKLPRTH
jgi:hypothetical protein